MALVYLSIGTNIGDKKRNLERAVELINSRLGEVTKVSSIIETEPWGFISNNMFNNIAIEVETKLLPIEILDITQQIEKDMGREHKTSKNKEYRDRIIDIDILLYDDKVLNIEERLSIPHPMMHKRLFVIKPMAEIVPHISHPTIKKTMLQLFSELEE